jgi:hypothetical protein
LEPAVARNAGPWHRWNALQYLRDTLPARLDQERRLVAGVESNQALRHWCRAVEDDLGPLPIALVPAALHDTLPGLSAETNAHVA